MIKKYRVVNKVRFYLFIVSVSVVTTAIIMSLLSVNEVYSSIHQYDYDEIKIAEGDTLWEVARSHKPKDYDLRKMVYEIKEFNNMKKSNIYPGDIIKIPNIKK